MQHLNQGTTQKSIHRVGQNYPLPSKTDQMHQTPYKSIKSYIKPATTTKKQLQLSRSGKNHLKLSTTIDKDLDQSRTQQIDLHVTPEPTNTV